MNNKNKFFKPAAVTLITCLAAFAFPKQIEAQMSNQFYGLEGPVGRQMLNPAFANRYNYISFPLLGNISLHGAANYGAANFIFPKNGKTVTFMSPDVTDNEFLKDLPDKNEAFMSSKLVILETGFKMAGGYATLSAGLDTYASVQVPKSLFEFMKLGMNNEDVTKYQINDLHANAMSMYDVALGYSRSINKQWRVGANVHLLLGTNAVNAKVNKMDITMSKDKYEIQNKDSYLAYSDFVQFANKKDEHGAETDEVDFSDNTIEYKNLPKVKGFGMAVDLGATYQFDDDLTLSASLLNLGSVKYNKMEKLHMRSDYTFDGFTYDPNSDESLSKQGDQIADDLKDFYKMRRSKDHQAISESYALPIYLNVGARYRMPFFSKLYVNGLFHSCLNHKAAGTGLLVSADLQPVKWFGMSLSADFANTGIKPGVALSLHPRGFNFFIAAQSVIGKTTKGVRIPLKSSGMSVNLGMDITF